MFGIFLISRATSSATLRSAKLSYCWLQSVRATIGTSSIDLGFTTAGPAPGGIFSGFAIILV